MAYRNYTVTVQNISNYDPNNALELFLFEDRVEIKDNPATGYKDVYIYGTTRLAREAPPSGAMVFDRYGGQARAAADDPVNKPGEYTFEQVELNLPNSLSILGQAVYSVVARPIANAVVDDNFNNSSVIIDRTHISDPVTKANVYLTKGSFGSSIDNIYFAGGSVEFDQFSGDSVVNSATAQHLVLENLPESIKALYLKETLQAPPFGPTDPPTQVLIPRFNIIYSGNSGADVIIWADVRAFAMTDGSWVIKLQADQYCAYRSKDFGTNPSTQINMSSVWNSFKVGINFSDNNILLKRFTSLPAVPSGQKGTAQELGSFCVLDETSGVPNVSSLHYLDNYATNLYKWKQVLVSETQGVAWDETYNPNKSRALLADGSNCLCNAPASPGSSKGILNLLPWWPTAGTVYPMRLVAGNVDSGKVGVADGTPFNQLSLQIGSDITVGQDYTDIVWTRHTPLSIAPLGDSLAAQEYRIGINTTPQYTTAYNLVVDGNTLKAANFFGSVFLANDASALSFNIQAVGTKGTDLNTSVIVGGSGATTKGRLSIYERISAVDPPTAKPANPPSGYSAIWSYFDNSSDYHLRWIDGGGTDHKILLETGATVDHYLKDHLGTPYIEGAGEDSSIHTYQTTFYSSEAYTATPKHVLAFKGRYDAVPNDVVMCYISMEKGTSVLDSEAGEINFYCRDVAGTGYTKIVSFYEDFVEVNDDLLVTGALDVTEGSNYVRFSEFGAGALDIDVSGCVIDSSGALDLFFATYLTIGASASDDMIEMNRSGTGDYILVHTSGYLDILANTDDENNQGGLYANSSSTILWHTGNVYINNTDTSTTPFLNAAYVGATNSSVIIACKTDQNCYMRVQHTASGETNARMQVNGSSYVWVYDDTGDYYVRILTAYCWLTASTEFKGVFGSTNFLHVNASGATLNMPTSVTHDGVLTLIGANTTTSGGAISLYGVVHGTYPGQVRIATATADGDIYLIRQGANRLVMTSGSTVMSAHASSSFTWVIGGPSLSGADANMILWGSTSINPGRVSIFTGSSTGDFLLDWRGTRNVFETTSGTTGAVWVRTPRSTDCYLTITANVGVTLGAAQLVHSRSVEIKAGASFVTVFEANSTTTYVRGAADSGDLISITDSVMSLVHDTAVHIQTTAANYINIGSTQADLEHGAIVRIRINGNSKIYATATAVEIGPTVNVSQDSLTINNSSAYFRSGGELAFGYGTPAGAQSNGIGDHTGLSLRHYIGNFKASAVFVTRYGLSFPKYLGSLSTVSYFAEFDLNAGSGHDMLQSSISGSGTQYIRVKIEGLDYAILATRTT